MYSQVGGLSIYLPTYLFFLSVYVPTMCTLRTRIYNLFTWLPYFPVYVPCVAYSQDAGLSTYLPTYLLSCLYVFVVCILRPRVRCHEGHLRLEGGANRNISLSTQGSGAVLVNGVDVAGSLRLVSVPS